MGHIVLMVPDLEPAVRFSAGVMGFRISDYMLAPFKATFLHANPRHHSLAILEVGVRALHHFMVELNSVDDVGRDRGVHHRPGHRPRRAGVASDGPGPDGGLSLEELRRHLEGLGMARPFWPERLEVREWLPKTASGKTQKFVLRQELASA